MWPIGTTVPLVSDRSTLFFFFTQGGEILGLPFIYWGEKPKMLLC